MSGRLVGPAAFKAVEGSFARLLVGSIPIHSRAFACATVRLFLPILLGFSDIELPCGTRTEARTPTHVAAPE